MFKKGSTIIEVLIAATLISMAIIAALSLSTKTQKQSDFSRDLNQATVFNNQAIDWLRNMRTVMGWAEFVNNRTAGTYTFCLNSLPADTSAMSTIPTGACTTMSGYIPGTTAFQRELRIVYSGSPITSANVTVTTFWESKVRKISAETVLTNW